MPRLDWVWQPFDEPTNSALPVIAGRIAHLLAQIELSAIPQPLPLLDPRVLIPVCGVQIFNQASFPKRWLTSEVDGLLAEHPTTPEIDKQCLQLLDRALGSIQASPSQWRVLLTGLPPRMQVELLQNSMKSLRIPNSSNWINIFQSVQYKFKTSWHYRSVLLIAALLSLFAGFGIWHTALVQPIGAVTGILGFAVSIIYVFWQAIAKGVEENWEPNLFIKLGVLGLRTYCVELQQLFQKRLVWSGIYVLLKFSSAGSNSGGAIAFTFFAVGSAGALLFAGASAFASASASASAFAFAGAFAGAGAFAVAVAFAGAFAGAFAVSGAGALFFAGAGALLFAVAGTLLFAGAFAVAFAGAFAFADAFAFAACGMGFLAGLGLGSWYRFKEEPEDQWPKFLAVLALPWFCTAPIVLGLAGIGLTTLFTPLTFLPIAPWQFAVSLELLLVGFSCGLWWWGQKREAMARNPLQGGLLEATLRAKYGRPRM